MPITSMKLRKHRCFTTEWAGFEELKPINVIIGRNNVGKSQLLDLIRDACKGWSNTSPPYELSLRGTVEEQYLRSQFAFNTSAGDLPGNHWNDNGAHYVDVPFEWSRRNGIVTDIELDGDFSSSGGRAPTIIPARLQRLSRAMSNVPSPLLGRTFRHLLADRDIQAEGASPVVTLQPNGIGATNVIRRHITAASMDRDVVQKVLLSALNDIFGSDGQFSEIQTRQHEDNQTWEIFLGQERKGLVSLSASGSGLKTVILTLLHLLVMPLADQRAAGNSIYAFEELENNLHPALLRRLLSYIEKFAVINETSVFLTTHSNVALDLFGASENAQIVHVSHDGVTAQASTIRAHFDRLGVIAELGARPADLLQANGIIWVEGPSDAIYLNKWIELISVGRFREGRDYICAFYGGSLLARTQFVGPEQAEQELVNLLLVNPNIVVICDSDRTSKTDNLKPRVQRIESELKQVPGAVLWITEPKEIEGYLSGELLTKALELGVSVRAPKQYEVIFPSKSKSSKSYVESVLKLKGMDKIQLAAKCAIAELSDLDEQFDWLDRMKSVLKAIERWNR